MGKEKKIFLLAISVIIIVAVTLIGFYLSSDIKSEQPSPYVPPETSKLVIGSNEYTIDYTRLPGKGDVFKISNEITYRKEMCINNEDEWQAVGNETHITRLFHEIAVLKPSWNTFSVVNTRNMDLLLELTISDVDQTGFPDWWPEVYSGGVLRVGDEITISGYNPLDSSLKIYYETTTYDGGNWKLIGEAFSKGDFSIKWTIPEAKSYTIYFDDRKIYLQVESEKISNIWGQINLHFWATQKSSSISAEITPSKKSIINPQFYEVRLEPLSFIFSEASGGKGYFHIYYSSGENKFTELFKEYTGTGKLAISWKPPELGTYVFWVLFDTLENQGIPRMTTTVKRYDLIVVSENY